MKDLSYCFVVLACTVFLHAILLSLKGVRAADAPSQYSYNSSQSTKACERLNNVLLQKVHYLESPTYASESQAFWSQTAWLQPSCIILPETVEDVSSSLKILAEERARFAIRGGGYMPAVGHASTNDGILIATAKLRTLSLVQAPNRFTQEYLQVGAGLNWGEVYNYLDQFDRIVIGGRVSPVGTSLLLGGGISYFSGERGWAATNVVNFEVVLADGRIVNANKDENEDLFWALKGGSNNFGIVTRYDLATYHAGLMWGGAVAWSKENTPAYLDAQKDFMLPGGGSDDARAALMSNIEVSAKGDVTSAAMLLFHGDDPSPRPFENFTKIPSAFNTLSVQNFTDLVAPTAAYTGRDRRSLFSSTSLKITSDTMALVHDQVLATHNSILAGVNCSVGAGVQPVTQSFLRAAKDGGSDPIDLDVEKGGFAVILIYAYWFDTEDDYIVNKWASTVVEAIEREAQKKEMRYPFYFINDASPNQDPFSTYGYGKSLMRLREIANKYDPEHVFQTLVPGFKLGSVGTATGEHSEL